MNLLKRIPIRYKGELHDIRLINFSVALDEVRHQVPAGIKVRDFGGRAMISMVDVTLKNMRATFAPFFRFTYRHIAFRLLVDDCSLNHGQGKGIFFLRSFTDKPWVVAGGRMMTDYNLGTGRISARGREVVISNGSQQVRYRIGGLSAVPNGDLKKTIGALDRAYSMLDNKVRVTRIQREKWPIAQVNCDGFENTFFHTARFEGAFRVFEPIYYDWLPPKTIGE